MDLFAFVAVAFVGVYLFVGVYVARRVKDVNDFYVMGRNAPAFLIVGTVIATNISSVTLIGFAGSAFEFGPLPYVGFYGMTTAASIFVGLYLGRYLWRMKLWTLPDFFSRRYPSNGVRVTATAIVVISMVLYLISILLGTSAALEQLFGWSNTVSVLVILGVITAFTFLGGMLGVVITDTVMFGVFFLACLAMAPFIYAAAGGWPDTLRSASDLPGFTSWMGNRTPFEGFWFLVEANVVGLVVNIAAPQLLSRTYIARSEKTLARAQIWVALLTPVFVFGFLYNFGLVPLVAEGVEPVSVFSWVATNVVPTFIGALALAGVVAAAMSTASSLFQQGAASMSRDIYQRFINPDASEARFMSVSRACVLVMAAVVLFGALRPEIGAATIVYAFLLASASRAAWLPALVAGVAWRRATTAAAFWSMTVGITITLAVGFGREFGVSPAWLPPNLVGLVVSGVILVAVSLATRPSEQELRVFREMREPVEEEPETRPVVEAT